MNLDRITQRALGAVLAEQQLTRGIQAVADRAGFISPASTWRMGVHTARVSVDGMAAVAVADSEEIKRVVHLEDNDQDRREDIWRDDGGQG